MIYYFCYDNPTPTGGNKITYRHASILNELGIATSVLHRDSSFRYPGFPAVPIIGLTDLRLLQDDILVIPEDFGPALNQIARGARKVIFNQNAYYSFQGYDLKFDLIPPYQDSEYISTIVVSEDNRQYLQTLFPGIEPFRLHISIDQSLFRFIEPEHKKRQFCFMTRKNSADVIQVIAALRHRSALSGWGFKAIEGMAEQEVADLMAESAVFLTFGHPEGISLSNLEAMSSGCMVVGYSGMGCREYFQAGYCHEIAFGDIAAFVKAAEAAALCFDQQVDQYKAKTLSASEYVRSTFSPSRERADLLEFYASIGVRPAR